MSRRTKGPWRAVPFSRPPQIRNIETGETAFAIRTSRRKMARMFNEMNALLKMTADEILQAWQEKKLTPYQENIMSSFVLDMLQGSE